MRRRLVAVARAVEIDHLILAEHAQRVDAPGRDVHARARGGGGGEEHPLAQDEVAVGGLDARKLLGHGRKSSFRAWRQGLCRGRAAS
jgi:hypothetical protein